MMNRKIHTTSTKCQYQAAASNPKWWVIDSCRVIARTRQTPRKEDPIITCRPWNPVAIKNVEPYTLSDSMNDVSIYSIACR